LSLSLFPFFAEAVENLWTGAICGTARIFTRARKDTSSSADHFPPFSFFLQSGHDSTQPCTQTIYGFAETESRFCYGPLSFLFPPPPLFVTRMWQNITEEKCKVLSIRWYVDLGPGVESGGLPPLFSLFPLSIWMS